MEYLLIPFWLGLAYLLLAVGWLVLLTLASWGYKAKVDAQAGLKKLGIVVPAHNEELSIRATIDSLRACDYPQELLEIFIIADNCTDMTATVAGEAGARVVVRNNPEMRGKGQALDWFLRQHRDSYLHLDGICILDADVSCDPQLFRQLSASLSYPGVQVVQGFNGVANGGMNWRTALMTVAFNIFNHLRMAGSCRLFGSGSLKGLGMAFSTALIARYGWPAFSEVEDMEFSLRLAEDGVMVHYNPQAIIVSEMAVSATQATSQRRRWEGGRFRLAARVLPGLLLKVIQGEFRLLPHCMELAVLPLSLLVTGTLSWSLWAWLQLPDALPLLAGIVLGLLFYVLSAQLQRRLPARLWLYLAAAPVYVLWKLLVYLKMMVRPQAGGLWQRTARIGELEQK